MDFSKFSDPDFEVKNWVNGALAAHKDSHTALDAHASTLVMKLQLFIQEVNGSLEETSNTMLQNLPRVLRDVEAVRQEASLLRDQMQIVKEDIKKVERETGQSMQTLVELDAIKGRMQSSLEALQEADNWTTLSADVEQVFASQDIAKIAEKLAGMQQSLHVLHDVPDFEERWSFLESLKNRLEALVSPLLITAVNTHATGDAVKYVQIFADIERVSQLKNYYTGCHKGSILNLWSSLQSSTSPLTSYLSTFYDELLSKWHTENVWCKQVSLEPVSILPALFSQSLEQLSPPLAQCLLTAVQGTESPTILLELRQAALRFVSGLAREVGVAWETLEDDDGLFRLMECVHGPYCQLLVRYPAMETVLLKHKLHGVDMSLEGGLEEGVARMSGSIPWVFQFAAEAVERCQQLTGGWGINALLKSIQSFLMQHVNALVSGLQQLKRLYSIKSGEEWSHVGHAFSLIQVCGDLLLKSQNLSEQLNTAVCNSAPKFQSPASPSSPFGYYDYLAVYHPEEHTAATELLAACQKGKGVWSLLVLLTNQMQALNEQAHSFTFDIIFHPLKEKLQRISNLKVWQTSPTSPDSPRSLGDDLPQFSLSPLPYITEVGDYLLTLPHQLEPFTSQDSPALNHALQQGVLPFPDDMALTREEDGEPHPSDVWLGAVARGTTTTYTQHVLQIPSLPPPAAQQLATDIAYLCNVLTALGQVPTQQLVELETLLKPSGQAEFEKLKESTSPSLYGSVNRLRTWH